MGREGGVEADARQWRQRADRGDRVGFTSGPLASEPIPLWCERLNERTRKRNVAAPTLPDRNRLAGKFGRDIHCIFKELEAPLLGMIEPEDNSFAERGRLVLVSEFYPTLEVAKVAARVCLTSLSVSCRHQRIQASREARSRTSCAQRRLKRS